MIFFNILLFFGLLVLVGASVVGLVYIYIYVKSSYNVAKAELIEGNTVFSNLLL